MTLREDESRVRSGNAAPNLSRVRRIALNMPKMENSCKRGVKGKRFRAAVDDDYLLKVIGAAA